MRRISVLFFVLFLVNCSTQRSVITESASFNNKYSLDLTNFENDQLRVKVDVSYLGKDTVVFCFPKIVPGIYGAMDFGQYIQDLQATDINGNSLKTVKTDINCWQILDAKKLTRIEYEVDDTWEEFNFEMEPGFYKSAASTFQEEAFIINPNCLFGYFKGFENTTIDLYIKRPQGFYGATSLNKTINEGNTDHFKTKNYHELVDNPIMYSLPDTTLIKLPNIDVEIACYSTSQEKISSEIAQYIQPLLEKQTEYLGGKLPVNKYTFILYHNLNPSLNSYLGDGLEHSQSTLILLYMPMDLEVIKSNVYGIASHEFFHTLMPLGIHSHEIANYDFNDPKFSRHLWLYEGTTEYFTIHMPVKSGLHSLPEFTEELQRKLEDMLNFDNSLSFTELSLNAMEKQDQYYNVYLKGTLINLCLDIKLRELSDGSYGVQNLVLDLLEKYGPNRSFDDEKLFNEIVSMTGYPELQNFFDRYVIGNEELPLSESLQKVGLQLKDSKIKEIDNLTEKQKTLRYHWINQ